MDEWATREWIRMSMVVRNNLSAVNTLNTLNRNHTALAKSLQTVSSGMRINSAKDDASGYAISERMRVQIRSLNQDNSNTQNGHSLMKVAEGAVQSTVDILKTLKEKVINAANDTNTDSDRAQIQKELNQSIDQINDNANVTYNGKYLVDGSKNSKGEASFTSLTNQSLDETMTGTTRLIDLQNRTGENLGIESTDRVSVSFVMNGTTYNTDYQVGNTTVQNIFAKAQNAAGISAFGDRANVSICGALGVTNSQAVTDAVRDANTWVTTTKNQLYGAGGSASNPVTGSAAWLYQEYDRLREKASRKLNTFTTTLANVQREAMTGIPSADALLTTYNTALTNAQNDCANTWRVQTDLDSTYPNPTTITNNMSNFINNYDNTYSLGLASALSDYTTAYNNLSTFLSNNPVPSASSMPPAPDVSAVGGSYSQSYDTSSTYYNYYNSAYNVWDEAVAVRDSLAGPRVMNGPEVGKSRTNEIVYTANKENALTVVSYASGVANQISGFTVSITDRDGNIKKSANASLDAWVETIRAENASEDNAIVLHTGTRANQAIKVGLSDMRAEALGLKGSDGSTLSVSTQKNANAAINVLDNAIQKALDQQTTIGAIESRLAYTSTNLVTAAENVTASESTIRDADMAMAMTEYTKHNILVQSSQAMLAQANQNSNQVLSLLR